MVSLGATPGCSFLDLVEVQDVSACVVRLWSLVVAPVFRELLCLGGCVPRVCFRILLLWPNPGCGSWCCSSCFCIVFDSAGFAGVVFDLTRFCFRLLEFLLLWLVRDWLSLQSLVCEAHPPLLSSGRDSLSLEFVARWSWWRFVASCVASSVSCKRECSLYRELRVSFLQVLRVASFPIGSECVAAAVGGACFERGCWFARAVVGFIVDLYVRVGVSRRLREPACGVAFTGAGFWSAKPVLGLCCVFRHWPTALLG
ncbi:hypothetical protein Taro_013333, partial [Colocasia esculenta]|nr:hypothetical protein [Colocasia esculenta]